MTGTWGEDALWISFGVGSTSAVLMSLAYFRFGGWRNAHMLVEKKPTVA